MRRTHLLCFAMVMVLSAPAMADSITPGSMVWDVEPGVTTELTVTKTITVDQRLSGDLDIFFLFDATASMDRLLETTADVASSIITELTTAYGSSSDTLRVGVGYYQDYTAANSNSEFGTFTEVPWQIVTPLGGDAVAGLQSLQNAFTDGHPSDPESGLYGLYRAATDPGVGWNSGTQRIVVWVGDTPSWDEAVIPLTSNAVTPTPGPVSLADTISALNAQDIIVEALSVGTLGLDGQAGPFAFAGGAFAGPGQASAIATMTGGSVTDLTGTALENITGTQLQERILEAIKLTLTNYEEVSLDVSFADAIAGLAVDFFQITPDQVTDASVEIISGNFDRSQTRTFQFQVDITVGPAADGTVYSFPIYGTLNGNRIVTEWDKIYVGDRPVGPGDVPEPSTIALMGLGLLGVGIAARRKLRNKS